MDYWRQIIYKRLNKESQNIDSSLAYLTSLVRVRKTSPMRKCSRKHMKQMRDLAKKMFWELHFRQRNQLAQKSLSKNEGGIFQ